MFYATFSVPTHGGGWLTTDSFVVQARSLAQARETARRALKLDVLTGDDRLLAELGLTVTEA